MNAHSARENTYILRFEAAADLIRLTKLFRGAGKDARAPGSTSSLSDENVLINLLWVAEHNEANVAHVFLRNALNVCRGDGAQLFQKHQRVVPATADQFVLRQLGRLGGIGFLADVVGGQ